MSEHQQFRTNQMRGKTYVLLFNGAYRAFLRDGELRNICARKSIYHPWLRVKKEQARQVWLNHWRETVNEENKKEKTK